MIYFIVIVLMVVGIGLSGLSVYFSVKGKKQNGLTERELKLFTAENGTSNKGETLDETEVLSFYSLKDLGLY